MAFVPNTIVKLLSVNFENDYKNVVYWDILSDIVLQILYTCDCIQLIQVKFTHQNTFQQFFQADP